MAMTNKQWTTAFLAVAWAVSLCLPAAAMAAADQADAAGLTQLSLEELMNIKVEKVYAASKRTQEVIEAPSSVTIITADDIRSYGYRTLGDALKSVRGFFVTYDRNYTYLGVRGFGRPGDYNTRVLLLVDGHAINDNIYDTAAIGTDFLLDVDLIDRIEISRGPGSSLYGSNALYGVINVMTKSGASLKGAELSGDTGSAGTSRGRISFGKAYPSGAEVLVSGTSYRSEGRDLYYREFDDPATNYGMARGADQDRSVSSFTKLSLGDFTLSGGALARKKGIPTASYGTVFNTTSTFTNDEHKYGELLYEHSLEKQAQVLVRISFDEFRYAGDYLYERIDAADVSSTVTSKDDVCGRWMTGEATFSKTLPGRNKATVGAMYKDNLAQDQMNYEYDPYSLLLDDRRSSQVWALYGQDEVTFFDVLIANAGVRYDHYDTFGGSVNPRLGLIYRPYETAAYKVLYGRAFRAPNAYELYYNDGGIVSKSNPDLDPETIDAYEAIYERYVGAHLRGAVSVYHYDMRNLIALETDPADGLLVMKNVKEVKADGIEFELEGKYAQGFKGTLSAAFQRTIDQQTGEVLANSPSRLGKMNIIVPLFKQQVFIGIEEQYTSARKTISGGFTRGFFLTNATLIARKPAGNLEVSLNAYNVFDTRYHDPASEEHTQDSIAQDGSNYRLKITYRF